MAAAPEHGPGFSAWQLVSTSAAPTLIVCILAGVGAALAHKSVLNSSGCQVLARIVFLVYMPALTFAKLVQAVNLGSIARLWPLILNMTVSILVGLASGALLARVLRTPRELRFLVLISVAFRNVGNLPLVFVSTLCHDKQALFYRTLGDDCERLGIAYTAFDIAAATLWQFTVAISIIRRGAAAAALAADQAAAGATAAPASTDGCNGCIENGSSGSGPPVCTMRKEPTLSDLLKGRSASSSRGGSASSSPREGALLAPAGLPTPHLALPPQQHPGTTYPLGAAAQLLPSPFGAYSSSQGQEQQQHHPHLQHPQHPQHQFAVELQPHPQPLHGQAPLVGWKPLQQLEGKGLAEDAEEETAALIKPGGRKGIHGVDAAVSGGWAKKTGRCSFLAAAWQYLRTVDWGAAFPPPSQAAILGIAVGCIPPLKALLYSPHPALRVISESLDTLGAALIPTTIPLLGAVLYRGPGASRLPLRVILGVLVTQLVLLPALLAGVVVGALHLRLFTPPDPMFLLTMLLSNATPTAINMQTLTVLYRVGESEMASILFWQYLASVLTLPAFIWVCLQIIHAWL